MPIEKLVNDWTSGGSMRLRRPERGRTSLTWVNPISASALARRYAFVEADRARAEINHVEKAAGHYHGFLLSEHS